MRILIVSAYGLPHVGGIEVIVDQLASQFQERGHEVTHVTSDAGGDSRTQPSRYRVQRVRAINTLEKKMGVPYPIFGPGLVRALKEEIASADVVHAHGFIYPGTVAAFALAQRTAPRTPLVLTEHVGHVRYESRLLNTGQQLTIRTLGHGVVRKADALVTYNDRVRDQLMAVRPSIEQQTILNGVDHQMFHPPTEAERARIRSELGWDDRPRALFVGRTVAKKGFPVAAAAVQAARAPIALAVAGSERLPSGTPENAEALGKLSHSRLAEVYRACDVMLVPSWGEGFPLAAQEALASGLPLIMAEDPGYAPNLDGAGEGVRIIGEPSEFSAALDELVGNGAALERARSAAATHAQSAFSWPQAAAQHEDLYRRLISPTQQGASEGPQP